MAIVEGQIGKQSARRQNVWLSWLVDANSSHHTRRALTGYFFALPWIVGLVVFWGGPILASFYLSFTEYGIPGSPTFIGFTNYINALTKDDLFWPSLRRTFTFSLVFVPTTITGALVLAVFLNQKLKGNNIYRTIFFIPHLLPAVAIAVLWSYLLAPRLGPVNYFLRGIGITNPPNWLSSRDSVLYTIMMINVWAAVGGNTMLIFLAGLQGISEELYEAAQIDGAGPWTKFLRITLPLLSPTIFFNSVLTIIASLKVFTTAFVTTQGGPSYGSWFFALHIYMHAFQYFRLGYASALAWILGLILIAFTLFQVWYSRRWVHYEGR